MTATAFMFGVWAVAAAFGVVLLIRVLQLRRLEAQLRRKLEAVEELTRRAEAARRARATRPLTDDGLDGYDSALDGQRHSGNGDYSTH